MKPNDKKREIIHSKPMSIVRAKNIAIWFSSWVITDVVIVTFSQKVIEVRSEYGIPRNVESYWLTVSGRGSIVVGSRGLEREDIWEPMSSDA